MPQSSFCISEAKNGPLRGDVYLPQNPRGAPVVVACHGFKGFKDWGFWPHTGRAFTEAGVVLVTFNFSGSGIGEDPETFSELDRFEANTIGKELEDLGIILDAVTSREISTGGADTRKLGLLGHSRGGGVALVRASRDPRVRALVTWAGVATFSRSDDAEKKLWRDQGYLEVRNQRTGQIFRVGSTLLEDLETHSKAYDPVQAARRVKIPTLILHGSRDEAVPVEEATLLGKNVDQGLCRVHLIQEAGHTFGAVHPFSGSTPELDSVLEKTIRGFTEALG